MSLAESIRYFIENGIDPSKNYTCSLTGKIHHHAFDEKSDCRRKMEIETKNMLYYTSCDCEMPHFRHDEFLDCIGKES